MRFRVGKYDAHEGQKRPMHQFTVRITDVMDDFLPKFFGEQCRVTLVRDGTNSAILRKSTPGDRHATRIGNQGKFWGVSFHETNYPWLALVQPGWGLNECETFTDYENKQIKFTFPSLNQRIPPRRMHRAQDDTPVAAPVAPPPPPVGASGDILLYIGDECFTSKGVPASMLEGIKRMVGNWE